MNEEKIRTAEELLEWGFISRINSYNTNFKTNSNMAKAKNLKQAATDLLSRINAFLNQEEQATNFEHTDEDGTVLFTTESEDDTLEVGMAASPDGTFTLPDGRTVTIADGAISEIKEPEAEEDDETNLSEEVERLEAENAQLRSMLEEATNLIEEFKKETRSNFKPKGRTNSTKEAPTPTREERKAGIKEKMVVKGGCAEARFPVVFFRHADMQKNKIYLRLKVKENANFKESFPADRFMVIESSDMLSKPKEWGLGAIEYYFTGPYSDAKLRFMIDNASWKVDDKWFAEHFSSYSVDMGYTGYLSTYFTNKLIEVNDARIARGEDVIKDDKGNPIYFVNYGTPQPYKSGN